MPTPRDTETAEDHERRRGDAPVPRASDEEVLEETARLARAIIRGALCLRWRGDC